MIRTHAFSSIQWIDLIEPTQKEIDEIVNKYDVDPIVAHDLAAPTPKTKAEQKNTHVYAVLHFPAQKHSHVHLRQEVDFVITKNTVITVHYETIDALEQLSKEIEVETILHKKESSATGMLLHRILRTLYQSVWDEIAFIEDAISDVEKHIFDGKEKEMVPTISAMSRQMLDFKKTLEFHDEILKILQRAGDVVIGKVFGTTLDSSLAEQQKLKKSIENNIELLAELRDTNNSMLTTKQNEIMKTLTILAFVTFPLTLIASIFSMDAVHTPILGAPFDFWIVLGIMALATISFFFFFHHKKWL